jgi:hypothetical protein
MKVCFLNDQFVCLDKRNPSNKEKILQKYLAKIALLILCCCISQNVKADTGILNSSTHLIEETNYSHEDIVDSFLSAAFTTSTLQNRNSKLILSGFKSVKPAIITEDRIKKTYPWLYQYLFPKAAADILAIKKWNDPIKIAFDFPNEFESYNNKAEYLKLFQSPSFFDNEKIKDFYNSKDFTQINNEVSTLSREISELIKLPILPISPKSENAENIGNLRIIFVAKGYFKNGYRPPNISSLSLGVGQFTPIDFRTYIEPYLTSSIVFSAGTPKQVDGYFLTNEFNQIQFAACYISIEHPIEVIKSLLGECLVRAMGLPGQLIISPPANSNMPVSYLNSWNDIDLAKKMHQRQPISHPTKLGDLDKAMLSILYSSAVKSNTDYVSLRKILNQN